jgi:hypothetical protein
MCVSQMTTCKHLHDIMLSKACLVCGVLTCSHHRDLLQASTTRETLKVTMCCMFYSVPNAHELQTVNVRSPAQL